MTTIFMDECGNTGEDLFSNDQPVFTLSSLNLTEEECLEIKQRFFGSVKASELKHASLVKRPAQQEMIINFVREMASRSDVVKFSVSHKRFILLTKIVDLIVEQQFPQSY